MQHAGGIRAMHSSEAPCVGLQQGISARCKYQMELRPLTVKLDCQCKRYYGRLPLVHSSPTMVCRSTYMQAGSYRPVITFDS